MLWRPGAAGSLLPTVPAAKAWHTHHHVPACVQVVRRPFSDLQLRSLSSQIRSLECISEETHESEVAVDANAQQRAWDDRQGIPPRPDTKETNDPRQPSHRTCQEEDDVEKQHGGWLFASRAVMVYD